MISTCIGSPRFPLRPRRTGAALLALALLFGAPATAQEAPGWQTGVPQQGTGNTTVIPRGGPDGESAAPLPVRLLARLTADGQSIDQGLVWRIYAHAEGTEASKSTLLLTKKEASPTVELKPGDYMVNAAFGRAHLTRKITVKAGGADPAVEEFVLNVGGLRVKALLGSGEAPANSVTYTLYSDRDQTDNRKLVLSAAKPGPIMRLNAGIYHIVSTYGDCNATVSSDVTVEAGKLTEAVITHSAAKATFKLVQRAGGEALPDTQWTIQTPQGDEIKESVGALPTHILAPGTYTVIAKSQGKVFQRDVTLANGETTQVELVMN
jgi:hypothetical protein